MFEAWQPWWDCLLLIVPYLLFVCMTQVKEDKPRGATRR
jgi:hypothetical protein